MNCAEAIQEITRRMSGKPHYRNGGNTYRSASLLRDDADGDSFVFTRTGDDFAVWSDHKTGQSGSLLDLCQLLGIELARDAQSAQTLRPYRNLAEYAAAQGGDAEDFEAAGWRETTWQGRPALVYPTASGDHLRFIDGQKPKYKPANTGYTPCWYGLSRAVELARGRGDDYIVITNGAPSVVVGQSYGIAAAAVIGGERKLSPAMLAQFESAWDGGVVIALDCDATGRKAAAEIAAQFAGRRSMAVYDLRLAENGDLAQFCKLHSHDTYKQWCAGLPARNLGTPASVQTDLPDMGAVTALAESARALTTALRAQSAPTDVDATVAQIKSAIARLEQGRAQAATRSAASLASDALERLRAQSAAPPGLMLGIPSMDRATRGLQPGSLNTIIGDTGMGKSTLMASIAAHLITQGRGLIVPTEMTHAQWTAKLASAMARVPLVRMMHPGELLPGERERLEMALEALKRRDAFAMLEGGRPTVAQIEAAVAALRPAWILIDSGSNMGSLSAGIYERTVEVSNGLQAIAQTTGVPILMTWQINRDAASRPKGQKRPRRDDAQGGHVVVQDSATLYGLYTHQKYVNEGSEESSEVFPVGTSILQCLKDRYYQGEGKVSPLVFVNDAALIEARREIAGGS